MTSSAAPPPTKRVLKESEAGAHGVFDASTRTRVGEHFTLPAGLFGRAQPGARHSGWARSIPRVRSRYALAKHCERAKAWSRGWSYSKPAASH